MELLELFIRDELELSLLLEKHVLIRVFLVELPLVKDVLTYLLLGLGYCPLLFRFLLVIAEVFLLPISLLDNKETLLDLLVPELVNILSFIFLDVLEVSWHFVQEEGSVVFVSVGHILLIVGVFEILELAVHEGTGGEIKGQRGLVRLVQEVPDVDTIGLRDEDHTWSSRREGTTGVVGSIGWC